MHPNVRAQQTHTHFIFLGKKYTICDRIPQLTASRRARRCLVRSVVTHTHTAICARGRARTSSHACTVRLDEADRASQRGLMNVRCCCRVRLHARACACINERECAPAALSLHVCGLRGRNVIRRTETTKVNISIKSYETHTHRHTSIICVLSLWSSEVALAYICTL